MNEAIETSMKQKISSNLLSVFLFFLMLSMLGISYIFYKSFQYTSFYKSDKTIQMEKGSYTEMFLEIISNGWNDSTETLNKFIIKNAKLAIPKVLESMDEYRLRLAYIEYLVHQKKAKKAYELYIDLLQGLKQDEHNLLNLYTRVYLEKEINQSLERNLKKNFFSRKLKKSFKHELQELLILDKKLLLEGMRYQLKSARIRATVDETNLTKV